MEKEPEEKEPVEEELLTDSQAARWDFFWKLDGVGPVDNRPSTK